MRVFIYVEGQADKLALKAFLRGYLDELRRRGHGLRFVVLGNKDAFFRKFATKAAANLVESHDDCAVALPDLYPNEPYATTPNAHASLAELASRLTTLVRGALRDIYRVRTRDLRQMMARFHATAMKYDLEMLLLAAWRSLLEQINQEANPDRWRHPVENQDQAHPPKTVVHGLYPAYKGTRDAPGVLRRVQDMEADLFYSGQAGLLECPVFKEFLDWVGERTGVPVY